MPLVLLHFSHNVKTERYHVGVWRYANVTQKLLSRALFSHYTPAGNLSNDSFSGFKSGTLTRQFRASLNNLYFHSLIWECRILTKKNKLNFGRTGFWVTGRSSIREVWIRGTGRLTSNWARGACLHGNVRKEPINASIWLGVVRVFEEYVRT